MYRSFRRVIDIVVSLSAIIIFLPVFLLVILLLKLTGDGEVFYFQERIGFRSKPFYIFKFATMKKNGDKMGTRDVTVKNDPRLLPLGRFLRKTKLNELPQLFNILIGDMTLIGPRPLTIEGFERYSKEVQNIIYKISPGLTGIGSIIFRDEETIVSHFTDFEKVYRNINKYKGKLEIWYQQNEGFKTDLLIVFLTAYSIIFPKQKLTYKVFTSLPAVESDDGDEVSIKISYFMRREMAKEEMKF
jgi:lipopolysaccharide/colanic/teichoic acid biosynthesis glycosyltransferase